MALICQSWYRASNTLPHLGLLLTFQSSVQPFTCSPNVTFADCHSYFPHLTSRYFNLLYHPTHHTQFLCMSLLSLVSPLSSSVPGTAEDTVPLCITWALFCKLCIILFGQGVVETALAGPWTSALPMFPAIKQAVLGRISSKLEFGGFSPLALKKYTQPCEPHL